MRSLPIKLSIAERWILANQYRILEALNPKEAEDLAQAREAIERGYEGMYNELSRHISREVLSETVSEEVISILQMFRLLHDSYEELGNDQGLKAPLTKFGGFDANNESEHYSFARFYCLKMGYFEELFDCVVDSHAPMLPTYRKMLTQLGQLKYFRHLEKEQLAEIIK